MSEPVLADYTPEIAAFANRYHESVTHGAAHRLRWWLTCPQAELQTHSASYCSYTQPTSVHRLAPQLLDLDDADRSHYATRTHAAQRAAGAVDGAHRAVGALLDEAAASVRHAVVCSRRSLRKPVRRGASRPSRDDVQQWVDAINHLALWHYVHGVEPGSAGDG